MPHMTNLRLNSNDTISVNTKKHQERAKRIKFKMKEEIYRHVSSKYINDISVRKESAIRTTNGISAKHISTANGSVKREGFYT